MKLYFYNNSKCMGPQSGIQALHAAVELLTKYYDDSELHSKFVDMIHTWATKHKTVVVLNGGSHYDLQSMLLQLKGNKESPYAYFNEEDLNDALTSVAILCTQDMVDDMEALRRKFISEDELFDKYGSYGSVLTLLAYARTAN